jgi:hypothetical protein
VAKPHAAEHYLKVPFDPKQYRKWLKSRSGHCAPLGERSVDPSGQILGKTGGGQPGRPRIRGGIKGLQKHLLEHLRYPPDAFRRIFRAPCASSSSWNRPGRCQTMRALDELGAGCTEEAMRLVRNICWRPAIKNGMRVRTHRR